jgi:hypothetical protein
MGTTPWVVPGRLMANPLGKGETVGEDLQNDDPSPTRTGKGSQFVPEYLELSSHQCNDGVEKVTRAQGDTY